MLPEIARDFRYRALEVLSLLYPLFVIWYLPFTFCNLVMAGKAVAPNQSLTACAKTGNRGVKLLLGTDFGLFMMISIELHHYLITSPGLPNAPL